MNRQRKYIYGMKFDKQKKQYYYLTIYPEIQVTECK